MALASVIDGKFLSLTHDATTAWTWQDETHGWGAKNPGLKTQYIHWIPNATDDVICIKESSTSGPVIFQSKAENAYDQRIIYLYGTKIRPVIDQSVTTGAGQIIVFCIQ